MDRSPEPVRSIRPCIPTILAAVIVSILGTIIVTDLIRDVRENQMAAEVIPFTGTIEIPPTAASDLNDQQGPYPQPGETMQAAGPAKATSTLYLPVATQSARLIGPQGLEQRPYSANSPWNTSIGQNPQYDPYSDEMIATIGMDSDGRITSDPDQYSYPIYYADASTPRYDIPCTRYKCTVVTPSGASTFEELKGVPIPSNAKPSVGTDGQMIIIDKNTHTEYDLWQVVRTSNGWSVSNASVYNITWDGAPPRYGSRGAGVPYLAGLVRPFEITQGRIEHALAFAYSYAAEDRCVFPASKTDGKSDLQYAIPQGARIQLDPSLTDADFDRLGLSRTGKIIARALQEYGMILIDNSGRPKIYAEDLKNNPLSSTKWTDRGLDLNSTTISNIPYTSFRVIKLPEYYWSEGTQGPLHGKCFIDPSINISP
jgi:hypothetical protein